MNIHGDMCLRGLHRVEREREAARIMINSKLGS